MAIEYNQDRIMKDIGIKTSENSQEFFEIGADAKNVFIQNGQGNGYGDRDGIVDLQTKLNNFNRSIRNIGSGNAANNYATAFGYNTSAEGSGSHAEGYHTLAQGHHSHAEGGRTSAYGMSYHAEGYQTTALGEHSHTEGSYTKAQGISAHAEGVSTFAFGDYSHTEGEYSIAEGRCSHVEGSSSTEEGEFNHVEGSFHRVKGNNLHVEGVGHVMTDISFEDQYVDIEPITIQLSEGFTTYLLSDGVEIDGIIYNKVKTTKIYYPHTLYANVSFKGSIDGDTPNSILEFEGVNPNDRSVLVKLYEGFENGPYEFFIAEKKRETIQIQGERVSDNTHIQGTYCKPIKNCAHIVGGGSSLTDKKNIHTLDWDGNAMFAGDVIAQGCGNKKPVSLLQLAETNKSTLVLYAEKSAEYDQEPEMGDEALAAIIAGRQILVRVPNARETENQAIYSPVIMYQLPNKNSNYLYIYYLNDGSSPTNLSFGQLQMVLSKTYLETPLK